MPCDRASCRREAAVTDELDLSYLKSIREELHACPELAYRESVTQSVVMRELSAMGYSCRTVGTGVIAELLFKGLPLLAFRADMDALPIEERTGVPFASKNPGVMHACGHDAHMAMLLTFARRCIEHPQQLRHSVRLIFQPAEEAEGGAISMIEGGALEGVREIYALHVDPSGEAGRLYTAPGPLMAGAVEFNLDIAGRGAHCAERESGCDALAAGTSILSGFPALEGAAGQGRLLLHAGAMRSGTARNVVADAFHAECTLRYYDRSLRDRLWKLLSESCRRAEADFGVTSALNIQTEYIPVVNHSEAAAKMAACSACVPMDPVLTAEDFAFYLERVPGCLGWLGVHEGGERRRLHTGELMFGPEPLIEGVRIFWRLACETPIK